MKDNLIPFPDPATTPRASAGTVSASGPNRSAEVMLVNFADRVVIPQEPSYERIQAALDAAMPQIQQFLDDLRQPTMPFVLEPDFRDGPGDPSDIDPESTLAGEDHYLWGDEAVEED